MRKISTRIETMKRKRWNSLGFTLRRFQIILYYMTIMLFFLMAGCSSKNDNNKTDAINTSGVAIPSYIQALALPTDTSSFTASLFLDDGSKPLASATINTDGSQTSVGFNNIDVPVGTHDFTIKFELKTATYNMMLASARSDKINITAGSSQSLNFDINKYNFDYDLDGDLVTNIEELKASTPPDNDVCVLGVSLVGHCSLGV